MRFLAGSCRRGTGALVAAIVLVPAAPAAVAGAAPTWLSPPKDFSAPGDDGGFPALDMGSSGDLALVLRNFTNPNYVNQAAVHPAGGTWTAAETLSPAGQNAAAARVAVDGNGGAVAVWHDLLPNPLSTLGNIVQAATRPPGGPWSPARSLSLEFSQNPDVAVNERGDAVAVWTRSIGVEETLETASRPAGGDWGPAQTIASDVITTSQPDVDIDAGGGAVAVWHGIAQGSTNPIWAATRPAGGSWTLQQLSTDPSDFPRTARVAVAAGGAAVAVWDRRVDGTSTYTIQAATRPAAPASNAPRAGWSPPQQLSGVARDSAPDVAISPNGGAVAVWQRNDPATSQATIHGASYENGAWSSPPAAVVSTGTLPRVAVDAQGDAVAVWKAGADAIRAATRPAGGSWSNPPQTVFDPDNGPQVFNPELAGDAQGNAATTWDSGDNKVRVAGYDAAGPQLRALQMPATGTVASPLSFSVSPVDVWSPPVASTTWSFGDGSTATGASASHAYASPGSYVVKVSSTDQVGNSTVEQRTVQITGTGHVGGGSATGSGGSSAAPTGAGQRAQGGASGASELDRALAFRRCLRAARGSRQRRRSVRRQCVARHGRTPGRVRGMKARRVSGRKVLLSFRAPGTDGSNPPAARSYVVKQSRRPIDNRRDFRRARNVASTYETPNSANHCNGRICRFGVTDVGDLIVFAVFRRIRPHTVYHYAAAARDNVTGRLGAPSKAARIKARCREIVLGQRCAGDPILFP